MSINVLPLAQIELAIPDMAQARELLSTVFAAPTVEKEFARCLSNPAMDIQHVGLGQVVLQLVQPLVEGVPHGELIKQRGPSLHNLTWFVDHIDSAIQQFAACDLPLLLEFPMDDIWKQLLGEDNVRPEQKACIVAAMDALGFHVELSEWPLSGGLETSLVLPAHAPHWDNIEEKVGPISSVNIVVADLNRSARCLKHLFDVSGEKIERAPGQHCAGETLEFRVGEVLLRYCQAADGVLREYQLQQGSGAHSVTLRSEFAEDIVSDAGRFGLVVERCPQPLSMFLGHGAVQSDKAWLINTRDTLGMDILLETGE